MLPRPACCADRLAAWVGQVGFEPVLDHAGTTFRKPPEAERQDPDADKAIALVLAHPSMIKRPVLDMDDRLLVRFRPVTHEVIGNVAKAIEAFEAFEAFEATLITPASFDAFLDGDDNALTNQQKEGLALFMEADCAACHNGVKVGGPGYYPFGLTEKPGADVLPEGDKGRDAVTETAADEYVFRAAPLRNIALTAPCFHSGVVWDLRTAVDIMASSQLGAELTVEEVDAITAFLESPTGQMPVVVYPIQPPETATTPRPTGDVNPQG